MIRATKPAPGTQEEALELITRWTEGMPEEWAAAARTWDRKLRGNKRPATTRQAYIGKSLHRLAKWAKGEVLTPDEIGQDEMEAYFAYLATYETRYGRPMSSTTVVMDWRHLKVFFKWFSSRDGATTTTNAMARIEKPKVEGRLVPVIPERDLTALLAACVCDHEDRHLRDRSPNRKAACTFANVRDRAIIRLLLVGLRHDEVGLDRAAVDETEQLLTVRGKGDKVRLVSYGDKAADALDDYLRLRKKHVASGEAELWLATPPKTGTFGYDGVRLMLNRRCRQAGIARLNPHRFRHTTIDDALADGMSEGDVAAIVGHANTTMIHTVYARDRAMRRAVDSARRTGFGDRH